MERMKTLALLVSLATASIVGCGSKDSSQPNPGIVCPSGSACKVALDAKDVANYFAQFQYKTPVGAQCDDPNFRFASLTLADRIVIATTADGNEIVPDVQLYLSPGPDALNGTYTGAYAEKTQKRGEAGILTTVETKNQKSLVGTWSIVNGQLVTNDLGPGDAFRVRHWPGIQFTLPAEQKLNPALNGKLLSMLAVASLKSNDGKTREEICAPAPAATPAPTPAPRPEPTATPTPAPATEVNP